MRIRRSICMLMATGVVLASCSKPEPRSVDYFAAHEDEAKGVVADCTADRIRGQECDNARQGAMIAAANKTLEYKPSSTPKPAAPKPEG